MGGAKDAGVFFGVDQVQVADPYTVVIEPELSEVIHGMAYLDSLAYIGGRDFVNVALEGDGGVVVRDSFVTNQKDLVQLGLGQPADVCLGDRSMVPIDGARIDALVMFVVVVFFQP